jgi:hypothetical protein
MGDEVNILIHIEDIPKCTIVRISIILIADAHNSHIHVCTADVCNSIHDETIKSMSQSTKYSRLG